MVHVTCDFDVGSTPYPEALYKQLLGAMIGDKVQEVVLRALPDGHSGLSGVSVLLAYRIGTDGSRLNPWLVRVGTIAALANEQRRYDDYISNRIGRNRAEKRHEYTLPSLGVAAVAYDYLHEDNQPLQTLRNFLWHDHDPPLAAQAVHSLIVKTICQHSQRSGWYNDCRGYEEQRALWFYNTMLPPTLVLGPAAAPSPEAATPALARVLEQADSPEHGALLGQMVRIPAAALSVEEVIAHGDERRVRLLLAEPVVEGEEIYQPLRPIHARIELQTNAAGHARLAADLDQGLPLVAQITATRFGILDDYRERLDQDIAGLRAVGGATNPLFLYYGLLASPRTLHTSIVHGDMNLSNILLSRPNDQGPFSAWLIDFDKTSAGGHTVFDAVKLETEYKVHILPHRLTSVDDFLRLEQVLHLALVQPEQALAILAENPQLIEPYTFLAKVRRTALIELFDEDYLGPRPTAEEYYLGLLGYGLAALKYPNLYNERHVVWLDDEASLHHLATAAYLSAAAAARELIGRRSGATWALRHDAYPPAPRRRRQVRPRRLVGRERLLAEARRRLGLRGGAAAPQRVITLHGVPGSGRDSVGLALLADLEDRGHRPLIWPVDGQPASVEALIDAMEEASGVPFERSSTRPPSRMGLGSFPEQLGAYHAYLRYVLEDGDGPPLAFLLRLHQADPRLHPLLTQICEAVRRSAVVVVADEMPAGMPPDTSLRVPLLSQEDVRAYIRDYQQLSLSDVQIAQLWEASLGFPQSLARAVNDLRQRHVLTRSSLQEALASITTSKQWPREFMRGLFQRFSAYGRYLTTVEAALHELPLASPPSADRVLQAIAPALGWSAAPEPGVALISRQYADEQRALLYQVALEELPADEREGFYFALGNYCRQPLRLRPRDLPLPYVAAYYYARAEAWQEAAETLLLLREQRELLLSSHCEVIYELVAAVLANGYLLRNELELVALAGDCATYLCRYGEAIRHYERLIGLTDSPPLLVRLIKLFDHNKQAEKTAQYAQHLIRDTAEGEPLNALGRAYSVADRRRTPPDQALQALHDALERYQRTRPDWGDERAFFAEEEVMIYDMLTRAALDGDDVDGALKYLRRAFDITKRERLPPPLAAQLESSFGYIYYFRRGDPLDTVRARQHFEEALRIRRAYDDRRGTLISGQNLANLRHRQAASAADLDDANALFIEAERIAEKIEVSFRDYVIAAHMDLLIHRGEYAAARDLYAQVRFDQEMYDETRMLLWINRAKLALWAGDPEGCAEHLRVIAALLGETSEEIDQIEWAQLAIEAHLRLDLPLDQSAAAWLAATDERDYPRPEALGEWLFARGLLALAEGGADEALALLARSAEQWALIQSHLRAAIVACWRCFALVRVGRPQEAAAAAEVARRLLAPFGPTAAGHWLAEIRAGM